MYNISPFIRLLLPLPPQQPTAKPRESADLQELTERFHGEDWANALVKSLPPQLSVGQAAQKCRELVATHPVQVSVLLAAQPEVAQAVMDLLPAERDPAQTQLVEALLNAGHPVNTQTRGLSRSSIGLLDARQKASVEALTKASTKYAAQKERVGGAYEPLSGRPYLSTNPNYSDRNYNCEVVHKELKREIVCLDFAKQLHLTEKDKFKAKLQGFRDGSVSGISPEKMKTNNTKEDAFSQGDRQVPFSPEYFGKLLVPLALRVKPGETRSFPLTYEFSAAQEGGHAMCLFIENTKDSPLFNISFYDPNLTANLMKIRVLPEEMSLLDFDRFDLRTKSSSRGVKVLNINAEDTDFANALAGKFVSTESATQQFFFANALALGQHDNLAMAASRLKILKAKPDVGLISRGLHYACQNARTDIIKPLGDFLFELTPKLNSKELKTVFLAKTLEGVTGLRIALTFGGAAEIEAVGKMLARFQSRLDIEDLNEILQEAIKAFPRALKENHVDAIKAFCSLLIQLKSKLQPDGLTAILIPAMRHVCDAMTSGNIESTKAFIDMLDQLKHELGHKNLKTILRQTDSDGESFLDRTMKSGESEKIRFFGEFLNQLKSEFNSDDLKDIIQSGNDQAPFHQAIQLNQIDKLRALADIVIELMDPTAALKDAEHDDVESSMLMSIASERLGAEGKSCIKTVFVPSEEGIAEVHLSNAPAARGDMGMSVLSAPGDSDDGIPEVEYRNNGALHYADGLRMLALRGPDGTPLMTMAMRSNRPHVVEAVGQILLHPRLKLKVEDFKSQVLEKDVRGMTAWYAGMQANAGQAIKAYGHMLAASELSSGDLMELFQTQVQFKIQEKVVASTGWQAAWNLQCPDAIKAFADNLMQLKFRLLPEHWRSLIQEKDSKGSSLILQGLQHRNPNMREAAQYIKSQFSPEAWQDLFPEN